MIRFTSLALFLVTLASLTGCAASSRHSKQTASPTSNVASDTVRDESMWSPPEETTIVSTGAEKPATSERSENATSFRPNTQRRPTRGAVHAAY
jgi:hypothetical protein